MTYPDTWVAYGKVFDEDDKPHHGLIVPLYAIAGHLHQYEIYATFDELQGQE
jgi:hypothetical protein